MLAVGTISDVFAQGYVGDFVHGEALDVDAQGLPLCLIRRFRPGGAQFFHDRAAIPAEPGVVAAAAHALVDRRGEQVGENPAGVKEVPAAFGDGLLVRPARHHGAPVHGLQFDVEADLLQ